MGCDLRLPSSIGLRYWPPQGIRPSWTRLISFVSLLNGKLVAGTGYFVRIIHCTQIGLFTASMGNGNSATNRRSPFVLWLSVLYNVCYGLRGGPLEG